MAIAYFLQKLCSPGFKTDLAHLIRRKHDGIMVISAVMKPVIRLGDPTDHGGKVVSASSTTTMFGKAVALVGDSVSCPQNGHVNCVIVEGDPSWTVGGKGVALEGHKVSCGATLISTLGQVLRGYESSAGASAAAPTPTLTAAGSALAAASTAAALFDMHFLIQGDQSGKPLANIPYKLSLEDGTEVVGRTDEQGFTQKISASHPAIATIIAPYYEHNHDTEDTDTDDGCCACHFEDS
ncbi:PAAR domain-containing protein [Chromobacterium violaceum]|uniref:PAAR domain-containing protein n=2 Tax=Chromobacterium violaceum TaxID=536 RepID=UPI001FD2303C|nr:PAAR domain-containing protein [Chromobacterium violaceum]